MTKGFSLVIMLLILSGVLTGGDKVANTRTEPVFILSSILLTPDKGGEMYPEIAVNQDGTWRKSDIRDMRVGQTFNTFSVEKVETEVVVELVSDTLPVGLKTDYPAQKNVFCFGISTDREGFENKAAGKPVRPREVDSDAQKELAGELKKSTVRNVLEADWENIQDDYVHKALSVNIVDVMSGDLNGDQRKDYVIVLGDGTFVQNLMTSKGNAGPAAVIAYTSDNDGYKRVPLDYWEKTDASWPILYFIKDVNNDGKDELFMSNQSVDASRFMVYSWLEEGLKKLYGSKDVNKNPE